MDRVEDRRWSGRGRGRYSSLSRKKVRVRRWSYARPHKGYGWFAGTNAWYLKLGYSGWNWKDFEPSHHKRFLLAILLLGLTIGLYAWAQQPSNSLFHSYTYGSSSHGPDPNNYIWRSQSGNDFNKVLTTSISGASCGTSVQSCLKLTANSTDNAIALSKAPIGDLSQIANRELLFETLWNVSFSQPGANTFWGFYLTRNSTLPSVHNSNYDPRKDPNVALIVAVIDTSGSNVFASDTWVQKQATETIFNEDPGTAACTGDATGNTGSLFLCNSGGTIPSYTGSLELELNYTGNTNQSACSLSALSVGGSGCSWLTFGIGGPTTFGSFSQTLPYSFFQAQTFYIGFFSNTQVPVTFAFDQSYPNVNCLLNGCMNIQSYIPSPPAPVSPPSVVDTGGILGSIVRPLIQIGVFMLSNIFSFFAFLASIFGPVLASVLNVLEGFIQHALNVAGSAFGFPTLGDTIFSFINSLITVFTTAVPNAFAQIVNIFNGWLNSLTIVFTTGVIGQIFSFLSSVLTFGVNIIVFAFGVFTTGLSWTTIFVPFWLFIWFFGYNADDGMDGWIKWFDFAKWLSFDIGVKYVTLVINWAIDVTTALMALLPKPFVQIAGRFPRVPILEIHGSFSAPSFDGRALREGNLFAILGMLGGFIGFVWYELTQSSIPGTLANEFAGQPFIQSATTAIVFYKLFLPMAVLTVFLLMIPTLFTSIFGVIVPGPSVGLPSLGSRPRRGVSIQGGSGPLIRKREAGKRSSSFIKGRLEKIEGREKEAKKLRNQREEEAKQRREQAESAKREEAVRKNEEAKKASVEKERRRQEQSVSRDEAMFGQ